MPPSNHVRTESLRFIDSLNPPETQKSIQTWESTAQVIEHGGQYLQGVGGLQVTPDGRMEPHPGEKLDMVYHRLVSGERKASGSVNPAPPTRRTSTDRSEDPLSEPAVDRTVSPSPP